MPIGAGLDTKLCLTLCNPMDCNSTRLLCPWDFPDHNTVMVDSIILESLLQGIYPTQGSNPGLPHWQADSLPLSHQGSLFIRLQ